MPACLNFADRELGYNVIALESLQIEGLGGWGSSAEVWFRIFGRWGMKHNGLVDYHRVVRYIPRRVSTRRNCAGTKYEHCKLQIELVLLEVSQNHLCAAYMFGLPRVTTYQTSYSLVPYKMTSTRL